MTIVVFQLSHDITLASLRVVDIIYLFSRRLAAASWRSVLVGWRTVNQARKMLIDLFDVRLGCSPTFINETSCEGRVGACASLGEGSQPIEVTFDNVMLRVP